MTESGCQQCGENTFSGAGASSCTSCPDRKLSAAGSTSVADCSYGKTDDFLYERRIYLSDENMDIHSVF